MRNRFPVATLTLLALSAINYQLSPAVAQGTGFTYQGRLNDSGNPANGTYDIRAGIYTTNSDGAVFAGPIINSAVAVTNGLFNIFLDYGTGVFDGTPYWLQVAVRTNGASTFTVLSPRQQLTPSPYAIFANIAGNVTGGGSGLTNVNAVALDGLNAGTFWQLGGNNVSSGQILGCTNNTLLDLYANGVRALRLNMGTDASATYSNAPNVIGGSSVNQVTTGVVGAVIAGGGSFNLSGGPLPNMVTADFGMIMGGVYNTASGQFSTIIGGSGNTASGDYATAGGFLSVAAGRWSTISGGNQSYATNDFATVSGGFGNGAQGVATSVGGGEGNTAHGSDATVAGGNQNTASGNSATVGGGENNNATAEDATICGGSYNTADAIGSFIGGGGYDGNYGAGNKVQSKAAAICGGFGNNIPGGAIYSFIGGGAFNTASGASSTVDGGTNNTASGDSSWAAGANAVANNDGSFVWSDDSGTATTSFVKNQFMARASGGVVFLTDTGPSPTSYSSGSSGVALRPGTTSWSTISDRNAKKNFAPVDGEAVLGKLDAVPVQSWNYKWEAETNTPHIGPMAQDFKAAFYPGRDDKTISTLEFDGVELAAIQALNQKLKAESSEIQNLRQRNDLLEQRLKELEAALAAKR